MPTQIPPSPQELRRFIVDNFTRDNLIILCDDLESLVPQYGRNGQIKLDVIGGDTVPIITLNLIQFMKNRGWFEILVQGVCHARPNAPFCDKPVKAETQGQPQTRDVPMPNNPAMTRLSLNKPDFDQLVKLLVVEFNTGTKPRAFLQAAFAGSPHEQTLLGAIDFDGGARDLSIQMINRVCAFGQDILGRESLVLVINELKARLGEDAVRRNFLDSLVAKYNLIYAVSPTAYDKDPQALERLVKTSNRFLDVMSWRTKLEQIERQICRIDLPHSTGTGFLVAPDVVMTNYHVVEDVISGMYQANEVALRFDYKKSVDGGTAAGQIYKLVNDTPIIAQSDYREISADQLDFALLRVQGQPGNARGYITLPSRAYRFQDAPAIFIAQHPNGEAMKLTLDTDAFIELLPNATTPYRVRYRTNTEPGSSGSPCFNQDWELVALHHSGDPTKISVPEWNEGIPIGAIVAFLQKDNLWPIQ